MSPTGTESALFDRCETRIIHRGRDDQQHVFTSRHVGMLHATTSRELMKGQ